MKKLSKIGLISAEERKSLIRSGIVTCEDLLNKCRSSESIIELAQLTGISGDTIIELAKCADLMRINGINDDYIVLLKNAGVNCIYDLSIQNTRNLYFKILENGYRTQNANKIPFEYEVHNWIGDAVKLKKTLIF